MTINPDSKIKVRPLEIKDGERIFQLFSFLRTREVLPFETQKLIADSNCHCIVVEVDDEVVGFGALIVVNTPSRGKISHIEDVVVDAKCQGRGLGRLIMEELIKIAKQEDIHEIDLTSKRIRTNARKFYESLGFKMRESDIFRLNI